MGVSQIHYGYESLREAYIQSLRSMGKVLHWKSKREFLFCGGYQ